MTLLQQSHELSIDNHTRSLQWLSLRLFDSLIDLHRLPEKTRHVLQLAAAFYQRASELDAEHAYYYSAKLDMVSFWGYDTSSTRRIPMPELIVPAPCPPPTCNLAPRDVEQFVDALAAYHAAFAEAFGRPEQGRWSAVYLQGLLGPEPRKTTERIALTQGVSVRNLQHFIGQSAWATEPVIDQHQLLVAQTLSVPEGVVLIDESGVVKQGEDSVGVAPQYCGAVGKVANCQVGVYLGYTSPSGYTLLDARLYLPESWFTAEAAARRVQCGIPEDVTFQTKPELALELLQSLVRRGHLPFQWVAADALYGDTPAFLDQVAALGKWYFVEVACSTQVWWRPPELYVPEWSGRGRRPSKMRQRYPYQRPRRVDAIVRRIPKRQWRRYVIKEGQQRADYL